MRREVSRRWETRRDENEPRPIQACIQHVAALRSNNFVVVSSTVPDLLSSEANMLTSCSFWNTTVGKVANTVAQLFLKNDPDRKWSLYDVSQLMTRF